MSTFADTSALVKIYSDEAGHENIRELPALFIARISRVEVAAAFRRKQRMGELSARSARIIADEFELDYFGDADSSPLFAIVSETTTVLEDAVSVTGIHGLRAYDAIQLACARAARSVDPGCRTFAAFDKQLRTAAAAEGFALVPSELE